MWTENVPVTCRLLVSAGTDNLAAHPALPLPPHHQALAALLDSASIPVKLRAGPSPRAVASASESESESTSASRTSSTAHSSTEGSETRRSTQAQAARSLTETRPWVARRRCVAYQPLSLSIRLAHLPVPTAVRLGSPAVGLRLTLRVV